MATMTSEGAVGPASTGGRRSPARRLIRLALLAGLVWAVATWARSRKRRALDRSAPGATVSPPETIVPPEPIDGESLDPVSTAPAE